MTHQVRNLSITIQRTPSDVYDFVSKPENFAKWASGLGSALQQVGGEWIAETPDGQIKVKFSAPNTFGILDHWVCPAPDAEIYIPMRIIANGEGSELIFTLFRLNTMSDEQFETDADWVMRDLMALKKLFEAQ